MRTALGLFLAALVCIAVAWWVSALPGVFTATIAGTTISTSTPIAIALLAILFLLLYAFIRLVSVLLSLPRRHGRWQRGRDRNKGEAALSRTLIALAANDSAAARREADRSRRLLGDTPITLLLAAQAGKQGGRDDEATALYEMLAHRKDGRLLGLRGLLRMAVEREDWERAATIAGDAEKAHPGAHWLRDERRHMAQQTGRWQEALRLSGPDGKAAMALEAASHATDPAAAMALTKQAFDADAGLPPAAIRYAAKLRESGRDRQAQDVLRQGWAACPQPDIAAAYVAGFPDKPTRARELAVLVRANPDHEESHLAIAHAALEAGMVADARHQLEQARASGANDRRYWTLLAQTEAASGNAEAERAARESLASADADPVWRCTACGTQYDDWHAVCDNCRAAGSITWSQPATATRMRPRLGRSGLDGLTG